MSGRLAFWLPAAILAAGALFTLGIETQHPLPLRAPLASSIPDTLAGYASRDLTLAPGELEVAAPTTYFLRAFTAPDSAGHARSFSVYVGYYDTQAQGKTIHSPKNCLPGAGWVALSSQLTRIPTGLGAVAVNRYLIEHKTADRTEHAAVLYWYQGRGHVVANEYLVKWNLLRDAALRHRSDEALVRIVVPVSTDPEAAFATAAKVAGEIVAALATALPS